jgi:hypothetical protein
MMVVTRACVAGAMAGVVLATTCTIGQPSLAAAQNTAIQPAPLAPGVPVSPAPSAPPAAPPPSAAAPPDAVPPPLAEPPPPAATVEPVPPLPPPDAPAPDANFTVAPPPEGLPAAPEPNPFGPDAAGAAPSSSKLPSYIMWGVGGASLIVGAVFGGLALAAKSDFNDSPSFDRADTVDHRALVADVAFGLGAVLAITGTVFFFTHDEASSPPPQAQAQPRQSQARISVMPLLTPRSGGGAVQLRF